MAGMAGGLESLPASLVGCLIDFRNGARNQKQQTTTNWLAGIDEFIYHSFNLACSFPLINSLIFSWLPTPIQFIPSLFILELISWLINSFLASNLKPEIRNQTKKIKTECGMKSEFELARKEREWMKLNECNEWRLND